MTSFPARHADYHHTPDVCPLSSRTCADCLCEACLVRLFRQDSRDNLCPMYGCSGEDFVDAVEHNAYIDQREDLISRPGSPSSVQDFRDVRRHVHQHEEDSIEQIQQAHGWESRKKVQKTVDFAVEDSSASGQTDVDSPQKSLSSCSNQQLDDSGIWRTADDSGIWAPGSPCSPEVARLQQNKSRHMSGGGQTPNTRLKKARHYFFKDLLAGSRALSTAHLGS